MSRSLSICLPTYNCARFIGEAIESILAQTYLDFELIIVDNASTDDTESIVHGFRDERIKYYRNDENLGSAGNFNKCIELVSGEFIAIYHSDDVYLPDIVEKELAVLMEHSDVGAVFTMDRTIDETGAEFPGGTYFPFQGNESVILDFRQVMRTLLSETYNFMVCPTFMAKRRVFDEVGGFETNNRYGDWIGGALDLAMWLRINEKFKIAIIPEKLIMRRERSDSGTGQYSQTYTERSNHHRVIADFLQSPFLQDPFPEDVMRQYRFNLFWDDVVIAKNLIGMGHYRDAQQHMVKSFSWANALHGLRRRRNNVRLLAYFAMRVANKLGIAAISIKSMKWIRARLKIV